VQSVDLQFGLHTGDNDPSAEAWLDNVKLGDDLEWIAADGEGAEVRIHPEGQFIVGDAPFFVQAVQDRHGWFVDTDPLDTLRDRCQTLGSGPGGMEFNTLLKPPSWFAVYATKREARLVLDAAHTAGMKVILWLPLYPSVAEDHNYTALPLVAGLVEEWVAYFDDHPALLGWCYGDEKPLGQIGTAKDHFVLENYEAIPTVQARFRPIFLYTTDGPFDDGNPVDCGGTKPKFCLMKMFEIAHILMPNYFPIRFATDEPADAVPMISQWVWSFAAEYYGDGILREVEPPTRIERGVLPVMQYRPVDRSWAPPMGHEARTMAALAAAGHGVGYLAQGVGNSTMEDGGNPLGPERWDPLQLENRERWDAEFDGEATQLFEAYPEINRIVAGIAEKRFAGDPSALSLPPAVVTQNGLKPSSGTWEVEDSWITPADGFADDPYPGGVYGLRTGYACHAASGYCSGFGRLRFLDLAGEFDGARIEEAKLLLSVLQRLAEPQDPACQIDHCNGYTTPMSHISRIPGRDAVAEKDSLKWENANEGEVLWGWNHFKDKDLFEAFNHFYNKGEPDQKQYQDFGLQFLASARRDYGHREGIHLEPKPSNRMVDFDLTQIVRYWVADPSADQDRNNGLFVQPYSPTRRFEPHLIYEASDNDYGTTSMFRPTILVYQVPEGETPKALGAPFTLFYEARPGTMRLYELAHLELEDVSWLAAINAAPSDQCLRIYSNGHPGDPLLQLLDVVSPTTGDIIESYAATTTDAEYINFNPGGGAPDHCPESLTYGIEDPLIPTPWHPDDPSSYQPITRWDLSLPHAGDAESMVLIRIHHPSS